MTKSCAWCEEPLLDARRKYHPRCAKLVQVDARFRKIFAISLDDFNAIVEYQGGVCAICGRQPPGGRRLHLDHEHGRGPRGGLCFDCNRKIGRAKSPEWFEKAAAYLANPPAYAVVGEDVVCPGRPRKKRQPRKRTRGKS